ncbi:hypothetical protein UA75_04065 [Actinoalloteichus sp. GBA129-24]|uniref:Uncharacterized protein n=1 Tax=Actinoalloteichus fjordicus TaxID=1612552 RepID=A0AAC9LA68_9PSEU|nr:hypothetical protein UA74_03965 [Actinoalloteichus fjordicus]APU18844.1 hypothetical protein UA75_04065 [Actinoalloteichus sp. GBA129-24]
MFDHMTDSQTRSHFATASVRSATATAPAPDGSLTSTVDTGQGRQSPGPAAVLSPPLAETPSGAATRINPLTQPDRSGLLQAERRLSTVVSRGVGDPKPSPRP